MSPDLDALIQNAFAITAILAALFLLVARKEIQ